MPEDRRQEEARDALDRAARDSETVGSSSIARAGRRLGRHFAGNDAVEEAGADRVDPIEVWGRRIGRALSLVGVIALSLWLAAQLGLL